MKKNEMEKILKDAPLEEILREVADQSTLDVDKHTEFLENEREKRRNRVLKLTTGKKFLFNPLNVASLNATIKKVARKNNLLSQVPQEKFESVELFVRAVMEMFEKNNVSEEDQNMVINCFEIMKEEGINGKSKRRNS